MHNICVPHKPQADVLSYVRVDEPWVNFKSKKQEGFVYRIYTTLVSVMVSKLHYTVNLSKYLANSGLKRWQYQKSVPSPRYFVWT